MRVQAVFASVSLLVLIGTGAASSRIGVDARAGAAGLRRPGDDELAARLELNRAECAVARNESVPGTSPSDLAWSLEVLAQNAWVAGEYEVERRAAERALAIREASPSPDDRPVARDLHFISEVLRAEGDYGAALQVRERIGAVVRRAYGADDIEMAVHLHAMSVLKDAIGDVAGAIDAAERALAVQEKLLDPADPRIAASLNLLGSLEARAGRFAEAEPLLIRALSISESSSGADDREVARALSSLVLIHSARGDAAGALRLAERALAIRRDVFGPDHVLVARSLATLGSLERENGNGAEARTLLQRAIDIQATSRLTARPELARSLRELAALEWEEGSAQRALDLGLDAEAISREVFVLTSGRLSGEEVLDEERARERGLHVSLTAACALARRAALSAADATRLFDDVIRSRALGLDHLASRRRVLAEHADPATGAILAGLEKASNRLAHLTMYGADGPSPAVAEARRLAARADVERAERELASRSDAFRAELARERAGFARVAEALPDDASLAAYVRYDRRRESPSAAAVAAYVSIVLRPGGAVPEIVPLGDASEIDASVDAWLAEVGRDPRLRHGADAEGAYRRAARTLDRLVLAPVVDRAGPARRIFIVPDGTLRRVSFASLVGADGVYRIESGPTLHELEAERDIAVGTIDSPRGRGVLAIGDPDLTAIHGAGEDLGCRSPARWSFDPLPGSRAEAAEVASSPIAGDSSRLLVGGAATERAFKRWAPSFRVLHLGTHGFHLDRGEACGSPSGVEGLALAPTPGEANEDGLVTSEEVAALDLHLVDWAVLSACSADLGRGADDSGGRALRHAFRIAGVRTIITSLWSVDDEATRHWMGALYRARASGLSTAEAVRRAGATILETERASGRTTHPFFWGGFIATGDWR